MYQFLYSEVWWVETIIASLITAGVTLVGSFFAYNYKLKKIQDDAVSINKKLEKQNEKLEKQNEDFRIHHSFLNEHDHNLKDIQKTVGRMDINLSRVDCSIIEEKQKQKIRYKNLTQSQKSIVASIENLSAFSDEFQRLQVENTFLRTQNKNLEEEIGRCNERIENLENKIDSYENDFGLKRRL